MANIPYLLLALVTVGLIIFAHELGHFLAAKLSGIGVVEFSMGFGPRLVSWRRGRTNYSVRLLIPLGGFCKFVGDDESEHWYPVPYVQGFTEHSPALAAGMKPGDVVTAAFGEDISFDSEGANRLLTIVRENGASPLAIAVERGGERVELTVRPQLLGGDAQLGVILGRVDDCALPRVVHAEDRSALKPGDLIVKVNRRYVDYAPSGAMLVNRLNEKANGEALSFTVEREGRTRTLVAKPGALVLGNPSYELPGDPKAPVPSGAFGKQSVIRRILTIFAGPFMNFVLAFVAAVVLWMTFGFAFSAPVVADLTPGLNAEAAGMRAGDVIVRVAGEDIENSAAGTVRLRDIIGASDPGEEIPFVVERAGELLTIPVRVTETPDGRQIGIVLAARVYYPTLLEALDTSLYSIRQASMAIVNALRAMITTGEGIEQTAGPVGLVSIMTEEVRQGGAMMILNLIVLVSINLGIMNLLPLPALDGGRLIFLLVEGVRRKPVKPEREAWVHAAGLMLLMALFVVLTYRDIARLITGG